jgi:uncharacterized protein
MILHPTPLTEDELDELDQYLLYGTESDEAMVIDVLDGYLHAIAIAPITLQPRQWLPKVWGTDQMMPPGESARAGSITSSDWSCVTTTASLPTWRATRRTSTRRGQRPCIADKEYDDAEGWAHGFVEGMRLCWSDWQPLLSNPGRPTLVSSHRAPGGSTTSAQIRTSSPKHPLDEPSSPRTFRTPFVAMHSFWLPLRLAAIQQMLAKESAPKVGRNDPCPCATADRNSRNAVGSGPSLH